MNDFGWFKNSGKGLKIGSFPPERWHLWPGIVAFFKRNGGSFAPDYATLLVPAIKKAKQRRQIVIVTHNPIIAVVCNADQIIVASIDKTAGNKIEYESGAIENPIINKRIVDILEGALPAFDNRNFKYIRYIT